MISLDTSVAGYRDLMKDEDHEYDDGDEEYLNSDYEDDDAEDYANSDFDDGDEDYPDVDDLEFEETESTKKDETFVVLSVEEIQKRQYADVSYVCSVLSVSREVATLLLLHFNWNLNRPEEEWFTDEQGIRKAIGLMLTGDPVVSEPSSRCRICFDYFDVDDQMSAASCGHLFCNICWNSYISISIHDGPGCLYLRCPDPSCRAAIGEDMLKLVAKEDDQKKYRNYLMRSYVENNKKLKWCPAPDCDYAIEYVFGSKNFDVKCDCSYSFCWNCLEEIHRPVDCETVAKWKQKNCSEDTNMEWLLANSKPCPKCKKPIEKNQGCMHMTCAAPCSHEFCWLCLQVWETHESGFYECNKYIEAKEDDECTLEEKKRIAAKESIHRYTHYYERWAGNESSRKQSLLHLNNLKNGKLEQIRNTQKVDNITDIDYILLAWEQIIECRRVLKWAYAYGYYIPMDDISKKGFYEFTQGDAESHLERLHQCAEKEVTEYAVATSPSPNFIKLREKLCTLTDVARKYFDDLVTVLENGLENVDSMFKTQTNEVWVCDSCQALNTLHETLCNACSTLRPPPPPQPPQPPSDA